MPGTTFHTNVGAFQQANDEYITVIFEPKNTVTEMKYAKGSLKDLTGTEFESQTIVPTLQP